MTTTQRTLTGPWVSEPQGPAARGVASRLPVSSSSGDGLACGLPTGPHAEAATVEVGGGGGKRRRIAERVIDVEGSGTDTEEGTGEEDEDWNEEEERKGKWPDPGNGGWNRDFVLERVNYSGESARGIERAIQRSKRMSKVEKEELGMRKGEMERYSRELAKVFKTRTEYLEATIKQLERWVNEDVEFERETEKDLVAWQERGEEWELERKAWKEKELKWECEEG